MNKNKREQKIQKATKAQISVRAKRVKYFYLEKTKQGG